MNQQNDTGSGTFSTRHPSSQQIQDQIGGDNPDGQIAQGLGQGHEGTVIGETSGPLMEQLNQILGRHSPQDAAPLLAATIAAWCFQQGGPEIAFLMGDQLAHQFNAHYLAWVQQYGEQGASGFAESQQMETAGAGGSGLGNFGTTQGIGSGNNS